MGSGVNRRRISRPRPASRVVIRSEVEPLMTWILRMDRRSGDTPVCWAAKRRPVVGSGVNRRRISRPHPASRVVIRWEVEPLMTRILRMRLKGVGNYLRYRCYLWLLLSALS